MSFSSCNNPDSDTQLANPRVMKRKQNRLAQQAYRERLKAKLDGLQDGIPVAREPTHVDLTPSGAPVVSTAPESKAASTTELEIATPEAHHDPMLGTGFELENIDAPYGPQGCDSGQQFDFLDSSGFQTSISPGESSLLLDLHGDTRGLHENPSCFNRAKLDPIEHACPCMFRYAGPNAQFHSGGGVDRTAPVQDRIRHIIDQASRAGFTTFDEAIEAYYTETFDETWPLHLDQRLSRNRRLPRLLGALRDASKQWSHWERRGFQEQITQAAEEILVDELDMFRTRCLELSPRGELAHSEVDIAQDGDSNRAARNSRTFQDHLPNLWALATTLVARTDASEGAAGCEKVLRVVESLCPMRGNQA